MLTETQMLNTFESAGPIKNQMGGNGSISLLWPASHSTFGWLFWPSTPSTVLDFWHIKDPAKTWHPQRLRRQKSTAPFHLFHPNPQHQCLGNSNLWPRGHIAVLELFFENEGFQIGIEPISCIFNFLDCFFIKGPKNGICLWLRLLMKIEQK